MSKRPVSKVRSKTARPKSFKADGTPKKRWSSAERADRGHSPRRGGGRPRVERSERSNFERSERSNKFERSERPERSERYERSERRPERSDRRPERSERRPERSDRRPERSDRRPERSERRPERAERRDPDRRGRSFDKVEPRQRRDFRDARDDRRPERDDRRPERSDRPERGERRPRSAERFGGDKFGAGHHREDRRRTERREDSRDRYRDGSRDRFREDSRDRYREDSRDRNRDGFREDSRDRYRGQKRSAQQSRDFGDRPQRFTPRDRPEPREQQEFEHADTMSWEPTETAAQPVAPAEASEDTATESGFAELGLPEELVASLTRQGISAPFPIQAATIPDALNGRDVLGRGRTGSGKTLGFGLPLLTRLAAGDADPKGRPGAVVLVPTRELALQVADVLAPLGKVLGLSVTLVAGGMAFGPQIKAFDRGVDVVVATPGRLIDLMDQGVADLTTVQVTVLDEADHMADLGFLPEVTTILDAIPGEGQRLLFSATLDRGVDRLVRAYLHDPVTHEVDSAKATVTTMEHRVLHVLPHDKNAATAAIANRDGRTVIFVRTQLGADRVAEQLRTAGVTAGALHGGLTQGARARILAAFKDGSLPVLVATDVAARGIHVDEVSLVLQVDPPMGPKDYLHRAGRTARAGGTGIVASIVLPHQRRQMHRITGQAGVKVEPVEVRPDDPQLAELTGARTPSSQPVSEEEYAKLVAPRREVRGPKKRRPAWGREQADRPGARRRGHDRRSGGARAGAGRGPRSREG